MTYNEALARLGEPFFANVTDLYELEKGGISRIESHEGGRNIVYGCRDANGRDRVLRVAFLTDRSRLSYLAELAYIRYLAEGGASVANALPSRNGNLLEEIECGGCVFTVSLFERAKGICIADNQYRYRPGAPLSEYFYNCGKTLGKMHELSKRYKPVHGRPHFSDLYTMERLKGILPEGYPKLEAKIGELLAILRDMPRNQENYGMLHFDFSDGNYHIDYDTGRITVFDFDNCLYGWYLYDIANLWAHGVGWTQFEPDAEKRRTYMNGYFEEVLRGYRDETAISDETLRDLPLFVQAVLLEGIVDEFECMRRDGDIEIDEEMRYRIHCMEEDIPFMGFFDGIYSCDTPFALE